MTNLNGTFKEMDFDIPEEEIKVTKVKEARIDQSRSLMMLHVEVRSDPSVEATLLKFDPINYIDGINWDDLCFKNSEHGEVNILCDFVRKFDNSYSCNTSYRPNIFVSANKT